MIKKRWIEKVFNPFENNTSQALLIVGLGGFLLLSFLGYRWHFISDGIIQMHQSPALSFWKVFVNNAINTCSLSVLMYVTARLFYRKTRFIDALTTVLIAQLNLCVIALLLFSPIQQAAINELVSVILEGGAGTAHPPSDQFLWITVFSVLSMVFIVYFFYMLIEGMKIAMNSKKVYHGVLIFVLTIGLDITLHLLNPYLV